MSETAPAAVVVLAAGQGTRMKSDLAKVLHALCGRTMLGHVLTAVEPLAPRRTLVVVGHGRDRVSALLAKEHPATEPIFQAEQKGTGHAVRLALDAAPDLSGPVVVVPGDAPLLTTATLRRLLDRHVETGAAATLLTARVDDPTGYGRILRDGDGHVAGIVEERDADDRVRQIDEVGTSIYAFDAQLLRGALGRLTTDNAQGEEYLTDVVAIAVADGAVVTSVTVDDGSETVGINDRIQLAHARRLMRDRIVAHWMREGVTVIDPQTTWMGVRVRLEPDTVIHQNSQLHGDTYIESFAEVGPDTTLRSTHVGRGASVVKSHCVRAEIGADATVGPYSYLRPGTRLGPGGKIGGFVETKNAEIGAGTKVPHLTYVGDATIGADANIGAGTVFVNYDGVDKHHTDVGEAAFVGSGTMLVAPVQVGDGAYVAAGSVVTDPVPPGAIGIARARQRNVLGWVLRRRKGTRSETAARRAGAEVTMEGTDGAQ